MIGFSFCYMGIHVIPGVFAADCIVIFELYFKSDWDFLFFQAISQLFCNLNESHVMKKESLPKAILIFM